MAHCNSSENHPLRLITAVYCIFLILSSIVLPGNSPTFIDAIPSCSMRWILKHTRRLHISLLIYTDCFPLISELVVSQMSSLTHSFYYGNCYCNKSQNLTHLHVHIAYSANTKGMQLKQNCGHMHMQAQPFILIFLYGHSGFVHMANQ